MFVNSSSSPNASSSSTLCHNYRSAILSFISFCGTYVLFLLPLCTLVLLLGLRRWLKQRSSSSAGTASHSDVFTYHMVVMETMGIFACASLFCGFLSRVSWLTMMGIYIFTVTSNGQILFHVLTCTERYLAVIHPIIYLRLKQRGGVKIRNVSILCVWLLFFTFFGVASNFSTIPLFCFLFLSTTSVSFCSLSVLRALIRPGPGDGGKDKERVNQSKMKAFHTIAVITAALMFRFSGHGLVLTIYHVSALDEQLRCTALISGVWFCLPSSVVLPLLFLHRAGLCCKKSTEAVQSSQVTVSNL